MQGLRTLLSSPWYLNLGQYGEENWQRYHAVEPLAFEVTAYCRTDANLRNLNFPGTVPLVSSAPFSEVSVVGAVGALH